MKISMFQIIMVAGTCMMTHGLPIASSPEVSLDMDSELPKIQNASEVVNLDERSTGRRLRNSSPEEGSGLTIQTISGQIGGVGAMVSGKGVWVSISFEKSASMVVLDHNPLYGSFAKKYNVEGGVSGLWKFVGTLKQNSAPLNEFRKVVETLMNQSPSLGTVSPSFMVSSSRIGVAMNVYSFISLLKITDGAGNEAMVISTGAPTDDIFGGDYNANPLPLRENKSTINFPKP